MNVYLVTSGRYSQYSVVAAFSTEANAQQFIDERTWTWEETRIEVYPLDRWQEIRGRTFWRVKLYETGPDAGTTHARSYDPAVDDPTDLPDPGVLHQTGTALVAEQLDTLIPETVHRFVPASWWEVVLEAPDRERAIKVAAEQVAMAKARRAGMA